MANATEEKFIVTEDFSALLEETLGGLRIIKAFNAEKQVNDKFYNFSV